MPDTQQRITERIGTPEACEILGVSVASIARWISTGYLPAVVVGTRGVEPHVFDRRTVQALADRRAAAKRTLDWKSGVVA